MIKTEEVDNKAQEERGTGGKQRGIIKSKEILCSSSSVLLDAVRFGAAMAVLYSHFAHAGFASGLREATTAGNLAVAIFFVLSGFVIRFVSLSRETDLRRYAIDRASRIYSVVIPALLLSFLLTSLAHRIDATRYGALKVETSSLHAFWVTLTNLTFTSQLWGYEIAPPCNGPFWSIAYEAIYYVLYGLMFYRVRSRWLWFCLILLIAGPTIAFNGLFWLLGCVTYDLFAGLRNQKNAVRYVSLLVCAYAAALLLGRHPIATFLRETSRERRLTASTHFITGIFPDAARLSTSEGLPWLARCSTSFFFASVATALVMLLTLLFLDRSFPDVPAQLVKSVRVVADSTFTLYLVHLPMLVLMGTLIGHPVVSLWAKIAFPASVILLCILLSRSFDAFKFYIRKTLLRLTEQGPG